MSAIVAPSMTLHNVSGSAFNIVMELGSPQPENVSGDSCEAKSEEEETKVQRLLAPVSGDQSESPTPRALGTTVPPINLLHTQNIGGSDDDSPNDEDEEEDDDEGVAMKNDEMPEDSKHPFRVNSGLLPFPDKLMSLLDSDKVTEAMRWLRDGDAFCIAPSVFSEQVLDKYFQGTKFESFTRKLNRWYVVVYTSMGNTIEGMMILSPLSLILRFRGFKRVAGQKVPPNTIAYYHKDFVRGSRKLLKNMNGGKKKMISARERQLRAQQKIDMERDAALAFATEHRTGLLNLDKGGNVSQVAALARAPGNLGVMRSIDQMRIELLASNSMAIEQELNRRKFEQQQLMNLGYAPFLDTKQAAMPPQSREELQMQALLAQQRARQENSSNNWLAMGHAGMQPPGSLATLRYLELQRSMQGSALSRGESMATPSQMLLAQQLSSGGGIINTDNSQASILQRLIAEKIGGDSHLNARMDATANRMVPQQLLNEQQLTKLASEGLPTPSLAGSSVSSGDMQLLELYNKLSSQKESSANRIVQQQLMNDRQLSKLTSEAATSQSSGGSVSSGDQQLLELYLSQQKKQSENVKRAP